MRTSVNGVVRQDGSTDEMAWDMHYLVTDMARLITLVPGDVILSGTPAFSRPVEPGDVVTVEVEGLGTLTNHVVEGPIPVSDEVGAQPTATEEVLSTALGGDWEFRGQRRPSPPIAPRFPTHASIRGSNHEQRALTSTACRSPRVTSSTTSASIRRGLSKTAHRSTGPVKLADVARGGTRRGRSRSGRRGAGAFPGLGGPRPARTRDVSAPSGGPDRRRRRGDRPRRVPRHGDARRELCACE